MTKEECRQDLENGWNSETAEGRKAMLINAGWNAYSPATRLDPELIKQHAAMNFTQLPVDMQERMTIAYFQENERLD